MRKIIWADDRNKKEKQPIEAQDGRTIPDEQRSGTADVKKVEEGDV
jgi:hypothetical protein